MNHNDQAIPPIPLGVVIDSAARRTSAGKNYRSAAAVDDRFALHFIDGDTRSVAAAFAANPHWCGVLLDDSTRGDDAAGTGWAAALAIDDALLPVEFASRLDDDQANESFIARVFARRAWRALESTGMTLAALQSFYAQHKYLLMSRHIGSYREVGRLLAQPGGRAAVADADALQALAHRTIALVMAGLRRPATRGGHANALAHIRGYLKGHLSGAENTALDEAIEWYRLGLVPVTTPLALLRGYFRLYPDPYIDQQVYMQPALHARLDAAGIVGDDRAPGGRAAPGGL